MLQQLTRVEQPAILMPSNASLHPSVGIMIVRRSQPFPGSVPANPRARRRSPRMSKPSQSQDYRPTSGTALSIASLSAAPTTGSTSQVCCTSSSLAASITSL